MSPVFLLNSVACLTKSPSALDPSIITFASFCPAAAESSHCAFTDLADMLSSPNRLTNSSIFLGSSPVNLEDNTLLLSSLSETVYFPNNPDALWVARATEVIPFDIDVLRLTTPSIADIKLSTAPDSLFADCTKLLDQLVSMCVLFKASII